MSSERGPTPTNGMRSALLSGVVRIVTTCCPRCRRRFSISNNADRNVYGCITTSSGMPRVCLSHSSRHTNFLKIQYVHFPNNYTLKITILLLGKAIFKDVNISRRQNIFPKSTFVQLKTFSQHSAVPSTRDFRSFLVINVAHFLKLRDFRIFCWKIS